MQLHRNLQEIIMFNRLSLSALATFAVLATTALSPTSAAAHFDGGHGAGVHWGGHWGGGHWGGGHWAGWHRQWGGWGDRRGYGYYHPCWHYRCNVPTYGYYSGGSYSAPAVAYSDPPPSNPGCLAKGYLPDGGVVFTDRCTHEGAVADGAGGSPESNPPQADAPSGR
jgi:hypothetical protein